MAMLMQAASTYTALLQQFELYQRLQLTYILPRPLMHEFRDDSTQHAH